MKGISTGKGRNQRLLHDVPICLTPHCNQGLDQTVLFGGRHWKFWDLKNALGSWAFSCAESHLAWPGSGCGHQIPSTQQCLQVKSISWWSSWGANEPGTPGLPTSPRRRFWPSARLQPGRADGEGQKLGRWCQKVVKFWLRSRRGRIFFPYLSWSVDDAVVSRTRPKAQAGASLLLSKPASSSFKIPERHCCLFTSWWCPSAPQCLHQCRTSWWPCGHGACRTPPWRPCQQTSWWTSSRQGVHLVTKQHSHISEVPRTEPTRSVRTVRLVQLKPGAGGCLFERSRAPKNARDWWLARFADRPKIVQRDRFDSTWPQHWPNLDQLASASAQDGAIWPQLWPIWGQLRPKFRSIWGI